MQNEAQHSTRLGTIVALIIIAVLFLAPPGTLQAGEFHGATVGDWSTNRTVCRPIPLEDVRLKGFLGLHVGANNHASIPAGLKSAIPAVFEARDRGELPAIGDRHGFVQVA